MALRPAAVPDSWSSASERGWSGILADHAAFPGCHTEVRRRGPFLWLPAHNPACLPTRPSRRALADCRPQGPRARNSGRRLATHAGTR